MPNRVSEPPDPKSLVGLWWALHFAGGHPVMLQFRFHDDGTFEFADYSRGSRTSGTYTIIGGELILRDQSEGKEQRRRIISYRPRRLTLEFPEMEVEIEFTPDELVA